MDDAIRDALVKSLTTDHKAAYDALPAEKKDEFLGLAGDEREKMVADAKAKAEAEKTADPVYAEKAALEARVEELELDKQMEAYKSVPMKPEDLKETVKALNAIENESAREAAFANLAAQAKKADDATKTIGTSGGPDPLAELTPADASKQLREKEAEAAKADPSASRSEIIKRVQDANPDLVQKARS